MKISIVEINRLEKLIPPISFKAIDFHVQEIFKELLVNGYHSETIIAFLEFKMSQSYVKGIRVNNA